MRQVRHREACTTRQVIVPEAASVLRCQLAPVVDDDHMRLEPGTVEARVVTLTGQLETGDDTEMLVRLVDRIDGVLGVVNQVTALIHAPPAAPLTHPLL
jgi:hypothetical protein